VVAFSMTAAAIQAGTVTLEALLERGTQIVFAGCHSRRLLKVPGRGSEKVLSWPQLRFMTRSYEADVRQWSKRVAQRGSFGPIRDTPASSDAPENGVTFNRPWRLFKTALHEP
jgi:hypothetical protein